MEIVVPSISILAEPPVAVVDKFARKHKTEAIAQGYLDYLYADAGQEMAARHYFRPRNESILQKNSALFPKLKFFTIKDTFGGWAAAQKAHFAAGGTFDQIYRSKK